jgi:hypothetical protein
MLMQVLESKKALKSLNLMRTLPVQKADSTVATNYFSQSKITLNHRLVFYYLKRMLKIAE